MFGEDIKYNPAQYPFLFKGITPDELDRATLAFVRYIGTTDKEYAHTVDNCKARSLLSQIRSQHLHVHEHVISNIKSIVYKSSVSLFFLRSRNSYKNNVMTIINNKALHDILFTAFSVRYLCLTPESGVTDNIVTLAAAAKAKLTAKAVLVAVKCKWLTADEAIMLSKSNQTVGNLD